MVLQATGSEHRKKATERRAGPRIRRLGLNYSPDRLRGTLTAKLLRETNVKESFREGRLGKRGVAMFCPQPYSQKTPRAAYSGKKIPTTKKTINVPGNVRKNVQRQKNRRQFPHGEIAVAVVIVKVAFLEKSVFTISQRHAKK